jgi:hypothetical protein
MRPSYETLRNSGTVGILARGAWRVAARSAISPGGNRGPGESQSAVRVDTARVGTSPDRLSGGRKVRRYRITVRGEVTQTFVEPLEQVFVESTGDESILCFEAADQAKLFAVLGWLFARGVEIVSVFPDDNDADSVDPEME